MPRGIVLVIVTLVALGCSGGSPSGTPGAGGGGGVGGRGGAGGGGVGGGGLPPIPACLAPFAAACPIAGTCTWGGGGLVAGEDYLYCFGSGTRLTREVTIACTTDPPMPTNEVNRVTVRKPDGSVCYTLEWTCACQFQCEGAVTWKDSGGQSRRHGHDFGRREEHQLRRQRRNGQRPLWPLAFRTGLQPLARRGPRLRLPEPAAELRPGQLPLKLDNQSSPPAGAPARRPSLRSHARRPHASSTFHVALSQRARR